MPPNPLPNVVPESSAETGLNFDVGMHGVIFSLIMMLISLLQVKCQSASMPSPFENDKLVMLMFFIVVLLYATTFAAGIWLRTNNFNSHEVINNFSLCFGALAAVLLLLVLLPILGWITLAIWLSCFVMMAYSSRQELYGLVSPPTGRVMQRLKTIMGRSSEVEAVEQLPAENSPPLAQSV